MRTELSGRVQNEEGEPMANVVVNLATENQQILKESSDVEGRFTFKNIYETGAAVTLAAKYPGYATPLLARHNRLEAPQQ